jgi:hypothetical protein
MRLNAPVATPIALDELAVDLRFDHFNTSKATCPYGERA